MTNQQLAFVFPGQGSQKVGMLAGIAADYPAVRETFAEASAALGYDMWQLIQQGPQDELNLTEKTQPLLLTSSVALWRVFEAEREAPGPLALFPESRVPAVLPAFSPPQLTEADYRLTGLSLNGHPMRHVRPLLTPNGVRTAREIHTMKDGDAVAHAGLVICRQRPGTAKGFVFLTLEDETGTINVVITPQRFERQALLISRTPLLLVRGVLQVESGVYNIRAKSFVGLKAGAGEDAVKGYNFR